MSVRILIGDVRAELDKLPPGSAQMCVTSPPYWGLRSYLPAGHPNKHLEIGSEPTVDEWVRTMVDVFGRVKRVLRDDGTLWLNLGDSYAGSRCGGNSEAITGHGKDASKDAKRHQAFTADQKAASGEAKRAMTASRRRDDHEIPRSDLRTPGFKPKDMHGQPWRAAFALQGFAVINCLTLAGWADMLQAARAAEDWTMVETVERRIRAWDFTEALRGQGWYLRQEIIWHKLNPMPESVRDRCTKAHEHVFLFVKSERYYYDAKAISEPASEDTHARYARQGDKHPSGWAQGDQPHNTAELNTEQHHRKTADEGRRPKAWDHDMGSNRTLIDGYRRTTPDVRNAAKAEAEGSYSDGKSDRMGRGPGWRKGNGVGFGHGYDANPKPRVKNNASFDAAMAVMPGRRNKRSVWTMPTKGFKGAHFATFPPALVEPCVLAGCPIGGTVLDIFGGSGTTGLVADRHHRNAILIDLDERNAPMSEGRIRDEAKLFAEVTA